MKVYDNKHLHSSKSLSYPFKISIIPLTVGAFVREFVTDNRMSDLAMRESTREGGWSMARGIWSTECFASRTRGRERMSALGENKNPTV
jgi:hypothetical protein